MVQALFGHDGRVQPATVARISAGVWVLVAEVEDAAVAWRGVDRPTDAFLMRPEKEGPGCCPWRGGWLDRFLFYFLKRLDKFLARGK
jgi:hypothetical protein